MYFFSEMFTAHKRKDLTQQINELATQSLQQNEGLLRKEHQAHSISISDAMNTKGWGWLPPSRIICIFLGVGALWKVFQPSQQGVFLSKPVALFHAVGF